MFGNLAEMAKMMSKAKEIQANLKTFKEELPTMEFSATSPGSQVKITVSGDFRVKKVELSEEALKFWSRPIPQSRRPRPRRRRR